MTLKAGDPISVPIFLELLGTGGVAYASLALAQAAGWTFGFWQGDAVLASPPAITLLPMATAPTGWHTLKFALPLGITQLLDTAPAGYQASWDVAEISAGVADDDLCYVTVLSASGVPQPVGQLTSQVSYRTTEGDGFWQTVTVPAGLLTPFGYSDLTAAGWFVSGAVRAQTDDGTGTPAPLIGLVQDGANRIIQFGWGVTYPALLALTAADILNGGKTWNYDVQIKLPIVNAIVAVTAGANGNFKVAGDKRFEFDIGAPFTITGSTGNNASYIATGVAFTAGNTVITVANVPSAVADGNLTINLVLTAVSGSIFTGRQSDRT